MDQINKKYQYKKHNRFQSETGRKYLVDEAPVPSVTTILSATKNSKGLDDWRRRVGNEEADRIMKNASSVGTEMHKVLEYYYNNEKYFNATDFGQLPRKMAEIIKENLAITEVWGNEVSLAYNKEYAGTTDLVALVGETPTIVDEVARDEDADRQAVTGDLELQPVSQTPQTPVTGQQTAEQLQTLFPFDTTSTAAAQRRERG